MATLNAKSGGEPLSKRNRKLLEVVELLKVELERIFVQQPISDWIPILFYHPINDEEQWKGRFTNIGTLY